MNPNSLLIGSHISLNKSNKYLIGVVEESLYNGANTFMIFTGPPHNTRRIPVNQFNLEQAKNMGIDFKNAVVHAPYIINLATNISENESFSVDHFVLEIQRTFEMGIKYIILHPGYHIDQTLEEGLIRVVKNLKEVLKRTENTDVFICLETMAGKKNQIGSSLEELSFMIKECNHPRIAVCLDIVHLHDAGYDVKDKNSFLKLLDSIIPFEKVKCLHVGDSINPRGSKKDIHANFNYGHIGFDTALDWIYDERFKGIPIIIETPFWLFERKNLKTKLISPYKHEISLIKTKKWLPIPNPLYKPRGVN